MTSPTLALVALLPLALGASPGREITVQVTICSGAGLRTIVVPASEEHREEPKPCTAKVCHSARSRKQFDPAQ